jgi:hypothetical protein
MVVDQKRLLLDLWVGKIELRPSIGSVALTGGSCTQQKGSSGAVFGPCKSLVFGSWRASIPNRQVHQSKAHARAVAALVGAPSPRPGLLTNPLLPSFRSSADLDPGSNSQSSFAFDILLCLRARVGCLRLPQPSRWEPGPRTDSQSVTDVSTRNSIYR